MGGVGVCLSRPRARGSPHAIFQNLTYIQNTGPLNLGAIKIVNLLPDPDPAPGLDFFSVNNWCDPSSQKFQLSATTRKVIGSYWKGGFFDSLRWIWRKWLQSSYRLVPVPGQPIDWTWLSARHFGWLARTEKPYFGPWLGRWNCLSYFFKIIIF